jgi:hypothetical protein
MPGLEHDRGRKYLFISRKINAGFITNASSSQQARKFRKHRVQNLMPKYYLMSDLIAQALPNLESIEFKILCIEFKFRKHRVQNLMHRVQI